MLYRAALLRNRFADTILKAREKALEKVSTVALFSYSWMCVDAIWSMTQS